MRILSLDPSSTCTGWAVLETGEVYVASGRILPTNAKAPKGYEAYQRIKAICAGVRDLLDRYVPDVVVMEFTSGKRAGRINRNLSSLSIYGVAVGAVWREVANRNGKVTGVLENEWTRRQSKEARMVVAAAMFKEYRPTSDSGGDESDALMLNVWFQRERVRRGL